MASADETAFTAASSPFFQSLCLMNADVFKGNVNWLERVGTILREDGLEGWDKVACFARVIRQDEETKLTSTSQQAKDSAQVVTAFCSQANASDLIVERLMPGQAKAVVNWITPPLILDVLLHLHRRPQHPPKPRSRSVCFERGYVQKTGEERLRRLKTELPQVLLDARKALNQSSFEQTSKADGRAPSSTDDNRRQAVLLFNDAVNLAETAHSANLCSAFTLIAGWFSLCLAGVIPTSQNIVKELKSISAEFTDLPDSKTVSPNQMTAGMHLFLYSPFSMLLNFALAMKPLSRMDHLTLFRSMPPDVVEEVYQCRGILFRIPLDIAMGKGIKSSIAFGVERCIEIFQTQAPGPHPDLLAWHSCPLSPLDSKTSHAQTLVAKEASGIQARPIIKTGVQQPSASLSSSPQPTTPPSSPQTTPPPPSPQPTPPPSPPRPTPSLTPVASSTLQHTPPLSSPLSPPTKNLNDAMVIDEGEDELPGDDGEDEVPDETLEDEDEGVGAHDGTEQLEMGRLSDQEESPSQRTEGRRDDRGGDSEQEDAEETVEPNSKKRRLANGDVGEQGPRKKKTKSPAKDKQAKREGAKTRPGGRDSTQQPRPKKQPTQVGVPPVAQTNLLPGRVVWGSVDSWEPPVDERIEYKGPLNKFALLEEGYLGFGTQKGEADDSHLREEFCAFDTEGKPHQLRFQGTSQQDLNQFRAIQSKCSYSVTDGQAPWYQPDSFVKVFDLQSFRKLSLSELHDVMSSGTIVLRCGDDFTEDMFGGLGFSVGMLGQLGDLDVARPVIDQRKRCPDSPDKAFRTGTLADLADIVEDPTNTAVVNLLDIAAEDRVTAPPRWRHYAHDLLAFETTHRGVGITSHRLRSQTEWCTAGTRHTFTWVHEDADGYWTYVATGGGENGKYWMFFDSDMPDCGYANFYKGFDAKKPWEMRGRWIGVLVRPGDVLLIDPNRHHAVYGVDPAYARGIHFTSIWTLLPTIHGYLHCQFHGGSLTNQDHEDAALQSFQRLIVAVLGRGHSGRNILHEALDIVGSNLDSWETVTALLALVNVHEVSLVLNKTLSGWTNDDPKGRKLVRMTEEYWAVFRHGWALRKAFACRSFLYADGKKLPDSAWADVACQSLVHMYAAIQAYVQSDPELLDAHKRWKNLDFSIRTALSTYSSDQCDLEYLYASKVKELSMNPEEIHFTQWSKVEYSLERKPPGYKNPDNILRVLSDSP